MHRKVFISVLGTSNYTACRYTIGNYKSEPVRFVQEATLDYLLHCNSAALWSDNDTAYILLTDKAKQENWQDGNKTNSRTHETIFEEGLQTRLAKMHLPFNVQPIENLPLGNNESEIWEIFNRLYEVIQEGDELYFDLTHGFRYLPMLVLVLGNYAHHLKHVSVCSITYGNFEGRNTETNEALLVNLLPLAAVQDWAFAAGQYLTHGHADSITELCNSSLRPILREAKGNNIGAAALKDWSLRLNEVVLERQTCRGHSIIYACECNKLKSKAEKAEASIITPMKPIFESIQKSMQTFDEQQNIQNAFYAAEWCCRNGLYQQSVTLLQEYIVSVLCKYCSLDVLNPDERGLVNSALNIAYNQIPENGWRVNNEDDREKIRTVLLSDRIQNRDLQQLFAALTQLRNDLNHSGMRSNPTPLKAGQIVTKTKDFIEQCRGIFCKTDTCS